MPCVPTVSGIYAHGSDSADIYPEELLRESIHVAEQCNFSLNTIQYEYPEELVPHGETPTSWLRRLTEQGMRRRWPGGAPDKVREMVNHELDLIAELGYEPFFLTVHDLVQFARSRGILCQGRGSAANSAVCYCLGVTEVDPARMAMLFERFVSKERNEPPDIDVDFEHERREEVVQHIYRKYGRERAALAATVVTYRPRSAIRDVGKALGMELAQVDRVAKSLAWWDGREVVAERFRENGIDPESPVVKRLIVLTTMLQGFPRHLLTARGRLRDRQHEALQAGADRKRGDARTHGDPMGQGRPRSLGDAQSRCAGTRDVDSHTPGARFGERV